MQLDLFPVEEETTITEEDVHHRACNVCKKVYPHTGEYFGIALSNYTGKVYYKGLCKTCDREAERIRKKLRREYLYTYRDACDSCGKTEKEANSKMHLDHCYQTGQFRGWLCPSCNKGIGYLGECETGLQNAIDYLRRFKDGQP